MRELTKSMFGWSWAMSLFGMQQMADLAGGMMGNTERARKATRSFDNVTSAGVGEMGQTMRTAFETGNNMQRCMMDLFFAGLSMMDSDRMSRMAANAAGCQQQDGQSAGRWTTPPPQQPAG